MEYTRYDRLGSIVEYTRYDRLRSSVEFYSRYDRLGSSLAYYSRYDRLDSIGILMLDLLFSLIFRLFKSLFDIQESV